MTKKEIIDGLQFTIDMFCFNPSTGEVQPKHLLNEESRQTVDACEGAIEIIKALEKEPCEDAISRKSIKQKLQEHHDFFVNAYGGFSNLPQNDKSRVDEITKKS